MKHPPDPGKSEAPKLAGNGGFMSKRASADNPNRTGAGLAGQACGAAVCPPIEVHG